MDKIRSKKKLLSEKGKKVNTVTLLIAGWKIIPQDSMFPRKKNVIISFRKTDDMYNFVGNYEITWKITFSFHFSVMYFQFPFYSFLISFTKITKPG